MREEAIRSIIQDWVLVLPEELIKKFSEQAQIEDLNTHIKRTLKPSLSELGYNVDVKILSKNLNKIVRLTIENISMASASDDSSEADWSIETEDPLYLCLTFEDLSKVLEPQARANIISRNQDADINAHFAPVYASKTGLNHRVSLLPLYLEGTLDDRVSYSSYFEPASETSTDSSNYQTLCRLQAIQKQYFQSHDRIYFTIDGMESALKFRTASFESINTAIQLCSLAEKREEISKKSDNRFKRFRSAFKKTDRLQQDKESTSSDRKKTHIRDFFKFLQYAVRDAINGNIELQTYLERINSISENLNGHSLSPKKSTGYLEDVKKAIVDCNAIITQAIDSIQLDAQLVVVIEAQQKELLNMSILLTELFENLEQSDVQYYDLKATNFFVVDNKLVITDTKTLTKRGDTHVLFGTGHMVIPPFLTDAKSRN